MKRRYNLRSDSSAPFETPRESQNSIATGEGDSGGEEDNHDDDIKISDGACNNHTHRGSKQRRRRSDGERAPLATLNPVSQEELEERRGEGEESGRGEERRAARKRGRRGGCRKKRAGNRRNMKKTDRLRQKNVLIGYWNCRSAKQRGGELERLVYDFDIMMLQETKVKNLDIPGYQAYINPFSQTHHGQATLVREGIEHTVIDVEEWNREDREVQAVEVVVNQQKWLVVNLYAGVETITSDEDWGFLSEMASLYTKALIIGDYNARSNAWNNPTENAQGKALSGALTGNHFSLLNDTHMTRMAQRDNEEDSNIDLALVKNGGEPFTHWSALSNHGSDHLPCCVELAKGGRTERRERGKRAFQYKIGDTVLSRVRKSAWKNKTSRPNIIQPPWWNEEVEELWRMKRKAAKEWQGKRKDPMVPDDEKEETKGRMRQARDKLKEASNDSKKEVLENFTTSVQAEKALHKYWTLNKRMKGQNQHSGIKPIIGPDGNRLTEDSTKGQAFLTRYVQQTHQENIEERENVKRRLDRETEKRRDMYCDLVSKEDVAITISKAKNSAAGPDGVRNEHFKNVNEDEIRKVTADFNKSIETGEIEEDWLHSFLAPIPKPGRDHSTLKGYRIITMQNTYGKILEKIVAKKLAWYLETEGVLPNGLGSYRPGRETAVNAAVLAYDVYEGFQQKKESLVAAIDLEDAYNRVNYKRLIEKLVEFGVDIWFVRWIAAALMTRKVALRMGKWTSDPIDISPGLPQGSPLSPVLFNVYTAGVTVAQGNNSGRTLSFADDVTVYETGTDRMEMARGLQERLRAVEQWCDESSAVINPVKAQILWCSLNNHIVGEPTPPITLEYEVVERQESLRYLGIEFDRSLSFNRHIDSVITRAKKGICAIRSMAAQQVPQNFLFIMLQLVVLSVIDYGLGCLTLSAAQVGRLDVVQNEAMRAVLGCTKDTPIICMRYLLDMSGMRVRHRIAQAKMFLRVMDNRSHPLHHAIEEEKGTRLKRGQSWMAEAEVSLKKVCAIDDIILGKEWKEVGQERGDLTKVMITMGRERRECAACTTEAMIRELVDASVEENDPVIYTDGSVQRGVRSGWGFVVYIGNREVHTEAGASGMTTSSMRMEVEAITRALQWICRTRPEIMRVVILTDSQSVLTKIDTGLLRTEWLTAIEGTNLSKITWIYCPGHCGVKGNERADHLAGASAIDDTFKRDKAEITKQLSDLLRDEEDASQEESVHIERMRELGVQRGDGKKLQMYGRESRIWSQRASGTISMATLKVILERGAEHIWTCPECDDAASGDK